MEERRRYRRYDSKFPAKVELPEASNPRTLTAELRNISQGGAYILLNDDIVNIDSPIDLIIPDHENRFGRNLGVDIGQDALNLKILGRVVRVEDKRAEGNRIGIGLEFTSSVRFAPLSA